MRLGIGGLLADVRYSLRRLARRPLYVSCLVSVLAMAMGGSLVVFQWVDTLILRPLDVPRPHELVTVERAFTVRGVPQRRATMTWGQVSRVRAVRGLEDAAVSTTSDDRLSQHVLVARADGAAGTVPARFVTWNYFRVFGIRPVIGRGLQPADDRVDAAPVTVLSEQYWREQFGQRPEAIGAVIHTNGVPVTVVGVVPFAGTEIGADAPALFLPLATAPAVGRDSPAASDAVLGSRDAGGNLEPLPFRPAARFQVVARITGPTDGIQAETVARLRSDEWSVVPLAETMLPFESRDQLHHFLQALMVAVGLTLAVACVNVSVMLYGDACERRREILVRTVLGAHPRRVLRLMAVDYVLLAAMAGLGAGAVAATLSQVFSQLGLPGGIDIGTLSGEPLRIVAATILLTLVVTAVMALLPLCWITRRGLTTIERTATTGRAAGLLVRTLAVAQAAGCVVIAVTGLFFVRTVSQSMRTDLGFDPGGLLQAVVQIPAESRNMRALQFAESVASEIGDAPGIESVAIGPAPIVTGSDWSVRYLHVDGVAVELPEPMDMTYASLGYFDTLRPSSLRGRDFGAQDTANFGLGLVAIVNETAARMLWPRVDPIGRALTLDEFVFSAGPDTGPSTCTHLPSQPTPVCTHPVRVAHHTVVGVVSDTVLGRIGETTRPVVYVTLSQWRRFSGRLTSRGVMSLLVRSPRPRAETIQLIAEGARCRGATVESVTSVADALDTMVRPQRLARSLLLFLAGLTVLVTITGIYASTYMTVRRDQRAYAVRVALGARPGQVLRSVVRRVAITVTLGATAGAATAWLGRDLVERLGLGVTLGPVSIVIVATAVIAVGTLAAYVPSRRIQQVDPASLLRES